MFRIKIEGRRARAVTRESVTSGSVGLSCAFTFSDEWDGLTKIAVFRGSGTARDALLTEDDACVIPWEVVESPGGYLYAGVYGTDGEETVIPTVWVKLGEIQRGAAPSGEDSRDPSPTVVEQVVAAMEPVHALYASVAAIQADWENLGAGKYDYITLDAVPYTSGGEEHTYSTVLQRGYFHAGSGAVPYYHGGQTDRLDIILPMGEGIALGVRISSAAAGANGAVVLTPAAEYVSMMEDYVQSAWAALYTLTYSFANTVDVPIDGGAHGTAVLGCYHGLVIADTLGAVAGAATWSAGTVTVTPPA